METIRAACGTLKQVVLTPVAGRKICRCFYYFTVLAVAVLFVECAWSKAANWSSTTISTSSVSVLESLQLPTFWACIHNGVYRRTHLRPFSSWDELAIKPSCPNTSNPGSIFARALITQADGSVHCSFWRNDTEIERSLEYMLNRTYGLGMDVKKGAETGYKCASLNQDGALTTDVRHPKTVWLEWAMDPSATLASGEYLRVGMLDPALVKDAAQLQNVLENTPGLVKDYLVSLHGELVTVDATLNTYVDERENSAWEAFVRYLRTKLSLPVKSNTTNVYMGDLTSAKTSHQALGSVAFRMETFRVERLTMRYQTFDEIWAAMGGTWAACMLILTMFFIKKSLSDPDGEGSINDDVMMFRLEASGDRKDLEALLIEELSMANEAAVGTGHGNLGLAVAMSTAQAVHGTHEGFIQLQKEGDDFKKLRSDAAYEEESDSDESDSDESEREPLRKS